MNPYFSLRLWSILFYRSIKTHIHFYKSLLLYNIALLPGNIDWCEVSLIQRIWTLCSFLQMSFFLNKIVINILRSWKSLLPILSIALCRMVWFMVFNTTFNNISVISWQSVLLVQETRVPGENHRPAISWRERVNFQGDDDEIHFVQDQHALYFHSASLLKQQSADRHVSPLWHIILIPANQSLLFLLNAANLAEKQQMPIS